ncbi:MAG: tRNA pseudouridine(38-40) synthase TruA [Phycisphaerae bacterium]|nr:tRNA pseudouridine(38-40) synthase TruA [Phycisphaerae bacterium]HON92261.1 tRNA pseudouridine(38-40) synthase TruA [Sedimentisphaerales bacterium]
MSSVRKIRLLIAYDGTEYHGWQIQPGFRTVQSVLCEAATALLRCPTRVVGASRTDAGVHAMGQVGLIKTVNPINAQHLGRAINEFLPRDVAVLEAQEASPDFDLVGDVVRKAYRYTIYTGRVRPVRRIRFCWHYPNRLMLEAMQTAAGHFVGTHDFRSFAASLEPGENTVRTLFRCEVSSGGDGDPDTLTIDLEGDGFLHHMARILVGTLVDVGRGHWRPEEMAEILASRDRQAAGHLAPAAGLCLEWIRYRQQETPRT